MFIELSTADPNLWRRLQEEADKENEVAKHFNTHCFRENNDASSNFIADKRITFDGHGSLQSYARFTPKDFVSRLTQEGGEYQLPPTVQTIDLIGCNIGLKPTPNHKSYVEQFTELLRQNPKYKHIKVNAYIHPNENILGTNKPKYSALYSMVGSENVHVLSKEQDDYYKNLSKQKEYKLNEIKQSKESSVNIYAQIVIKKEEIKALKEEIKLDDNVQSKIKRLSKEISKISTTQSGRPTANKKHLETIKGLDEKIQQLKIPPKLKKLNKELGDLYTQYTREEEKRKNINDEVASISNQSKSYLNDCTFRYSAGEGKMRANLDKPKFTVPNGYRIKVEEEGLTLEEIFEESRNLSSQETTSEEISSKHYYENVHEAWKEEPRQERQHNSYLDYKSPSNSRFAVIKAECETFEKTQAKKSQNDSTEKTLIQSPTKVDKELSTEEQADNNNSVSYTKPSLR